MPADEPTATWRVRARMAIGSLLAVGAVVVAALALHAADDRSSGPVPPTDRADRCAESASAVLDDNRADWTICWD